MPKTDIILIQSVVGLGGESDQIKVAAGYARNYLFPQGLAIPLTAANKRRLEVLRQRRAEREAHEFNSMSELAKGLSKMLLVLTVKTGEDGKMFGSVTAGMLADELKHQFDVSLDKKKLQLERPIRTLGEHEVQLRLHAEVNATLKVRVDSSTPQPRPAETPAPATKEKEGGKFKATGRDVRARTVAKEEQKKETRVRRDVTKEQAPRKPRAEKRLG